MFRTPFRFVASLRSPVTLAGAAAVIWLACVAPANADWAALAALQKSGARVSASAVDLSDDTVIQQINADLRLTPASLTKLAVAAAALNVWHANRMFKTQVHAAGSLNNGQLDGDLYLVGAGDPSLTGESLLGLAGQIKIAGFKSVSGRLVVVPAPFASVECETKDRCDASVRSDTAYNAPLASIGTDFGTWCIDVRATTPGNPATITGCTTRLPIPVIGTIQTVKSDKGAPFWIERTTDAEGNDNLKVGGTIEGGVSQEVYRAMSSPALGAGLLLAASLADMGVQVARPVIVKDGALPADAYVVARIEGLVVKEQLGRMLRFSNNYIADVLTLTMAAEIGKTPPKSLSEASKTLSDFMVRTQDRKQRAALAPPVILSGSGLTPENEMSANDLIRLLGYQYRDARNFGSFYGGLVVPRQSPFAFLRNGSPAWQDRIALKTGTMDDPHSVCGMAGFIRKNDGGWISFAIIVNGGKTQNRHIPLYKALEAIRTDVEHLLKRY
jgi:D-alanyl-D-alanine carboxypeptidase/D-alanyl-D-alanine-endopeptidase (penicillin-binding protein 4)